MLVVGQWWLVGISPVFRALLGAAVAGFGIIGDLFESSLKRAANMKDASVLIPGHGGVLDRLDALLFAAPFYYVVVQLVR
jgi:phosphatidate cytidylyltransferase